MPDRGGFSFTSYADKRKLIAEGLLADDDQNWTLSESADVHEKGHVHACMNSRSFTNRERLISAAEDVA